MERKYEKILAIAKRRGFFWPSSEIHGGLAGFFDYGPVGSLLKSNIEQEWKRWFVIKEQMFLIETPTIMPEPVFKASGHLDHFVDPIVECKKCGKAMRADHLIQEKLGMKTEGLTIKDLDKLIKENHLKCSCGGELSDVWNFKLIFGIEVGPGKDKKQAYLRPETAQGMFVSFQRLKEVARKKLPFGACQIGHAYRNEISPRQGMIRLREFTQAEAEIFYNPRDAKHPRFKKIEDEEFEFLPVEYQKSGKEKERFSVKEVMKRGWINNEYQAYYLAFSGKFFEHIGIPKEKIRCRQHLEEEKAHYSKDTWDIEVYSEDFGWVEVAAIANRTDYDLKAHASATGEDFTIAVENEKIMPHVIEASFGIDRPFYLILETSYKEDGKRKYFAFNKNIAPIDVAVFPLVSKDGLPEKAKEVYEYLIENKLMVQYDESGSIGRRYARADEIGVPICVTIDYDTLKDNTVTIRDRDTTKQKRVKIKEKFELLNELWKGHCEQ